MKSEKKFWLTAVAAYTVAWGWSFFFANAYFWDDWGSFFGKTPEEHAQSWAGQEKHFLNPYINPILFNLGLWSFRVLIFALMFGAGVLVYKIITHSKLFSVGQCQFFTLVFLLLPVNHARFSIQTFEYSFSYFFFFLGWYLLLLRKRVWRVLALVALLITIGTPSFATFFLLPLANLFYLERPRSVKDFFKWMLRYTDIYFLVVGFALYFRTRDLGDNVEKFGLSKFGLFYSLLFGLVLIVMTYLFFNRKRKTGSITRRQIYIFSGAILIWLGTIPYWSVGYDPIRALPEVFQLHAGARIQAGEWFTFSMSILKLIAGFVVGFLLLTIIKKKSKFSPVLIPNIFMALYLVNNYFVGPMEWDSRLQLLWPLGLSLIAVGLFEFVPLKFRQQNAIALVVVLTLMSSLISSEYFVDSLKQRALISEIQTNVADYGDRQVIISEYKNLLNARDRKYRAAEWSGIVNSALSGDDGVVGSAIALKDDQSCPVSYRGIALYPRVKSSFFESLIKRKVEIEIGRIDLPVRGNSPAIRACPER